MKNLAEFTNAYFDYAQKIRRHIHQNPELGLKEHETSALIQRELNELGYEVKTGFGVTGVVGIINGTKPGKKTMLRFDMDALPVTELAVHEYKSKNEGLMHACGHDGHVAIGLTLARIIAREKPEFAGQLQFLFQPGEEGAGGAEKMIADGVLDELKPDNTLSIHLWNGNDLGWIGIGSGPVMAGADIFKISLEGLGGHGALPEASVDPVVAAAQIVTALQTVISRNVSSLDTAVLSVTSIQSGNTFNVIPGTATLQGTIRTFKNEVRDLVIKRFKDIANNIAAAMNCSCEIEITQITKPVYNNPELASTMQELTGKYNPEFEIDPEVQTMGSEDMSFFMDIVPGCFMFIGSKNDEKGLNFPHHHPKFDFDEQALINGVRVLLSYILENE